MPDAENTVLVVGSLHYDIMVITDHLPQKDETATGSRWFPKFGGKGGNQAVAVAQAGAPSRTFSAVGPDDFGTFLRRNLSAGGVDDRFVATVPGVGSGMSVAIQDAAGDYAATIVSGANLLIDPAGLDTDALWDSVTLLVLQNEVPQAVNIAAAQAAQRRNVTVLLNAAPARPLSSDLTSLIDILVVNAVEAQMMGTAPVTSLPAAAMAAAQLAALYKTVIVTAGALGLAAQSGPDDAFVIPAHKIRAVSSHGAGDCFIGVLSAALSRGETLRAACNAAAFAAAEHVAGRSGLPPLADNDGPKP